MRAASFTAGLALALMAGATTFAGSIGTVVMPTWHSVEGQPYVIQRDACPVDTPIFQNGFCVSEAWLKQQHDNAPATQADIDRLQHQLKDLSSMSITLGDATSYSVTAQCDSDETLVILPPYKPMCAKRAALRPADWK
jgi:hypothetical protein